MKSQIREVPAWCGAAVAAAVPWIMLWSPHFVPAVVALTIVLFSLFRLRPERAAVAAAVVALSAAVSLASGPGWRVALGWIVLALVVGLVAVIQTRRMGRVRPDAADLVALVGWATAFVLEPQLMAEEGCGAWIVPILLLWSARRVGQGLRRATTPRSGSLDPHPPSRPARGTLSLRGVVLGSQSLARTVPIDLELRAGDSLAVLCDSGVDAEALSAVLAGRQRPLAGEVAVDAMALDGSESLVAVVAPGERFLHGGIEVNLGALCEDEPEPDALAATWESCQLDEVAHALGDELIRPSGEPLTVLHRLLLLVARVLPSSYRVMVVVDQVSWLNSVQAQIWRAAVVRASVGRTAVWITADRELAARANRTMSLRHGALRSLPMAPSGDA